MEGCTCPGFASPLWEGTAGAEALALRHPSRSGILQAFLRVGLLKGPLASMPRPGSPRPCVAWHPAVQQRLWEMWAQTTQVAAALALVGASSLPSCLRRVTCQGLLLPSLAWPVSPSSWGRMQAEYPGRPLTPTSPFFHPQQPEAAQRQPLLITTS